MVAVQLKLRIAQQNLFDFTKSCLQIGVISIDAIADNFNRRIHMNFILFTQTQMTFHLALELIILVHNASVWDIIRFQ